MMGKNLRKYLKLTFWSTISWVLLGNCANAQVVSDTTLPNNSVVESTPEGIERITGGTTRGTNLFHSFQQFSVLNGKTVHFDNGITIENIISRVTGTSASLIDGIIKANGQANLFLLNPNGIIFTKNGRLDIGGSFIGTTANSIKFADGTEYSASNPSPLLTISIPIGLQFRATPQPIEVEGKGHTEIIDNDTGAFIDLLGETLEVKQGKTLALVGGKITISGGNLKAAGGRVELGSLAGEALVGIKPTTNGWSLNYENLENFQNITLSQAASINTSSNSGGEIQLLGRQVKLKDGSVIWSQTSGNGNGGTITISAAQLLEMSGISTISEFPNPSGILTETTGSGTGGGMAIATSQLLIKDGGQIASTSYSIGNAGDLTVNASSIELIGVHPDELFPSAILSFASGSGDGGNLTIIAEQLIMQEGASVVAYTLGEGKGGNLEVNVSDIEILGSSPSGEWLSNLSAINLGDFGDGDAGKIIINAENVSVRDGGFISGETYGAGGAGDITINTQNLNVRDGGFISGSTYDVEDAGKIIIDAQNVSVRDGGYISGNTYDAGGASDITINTQNVSVRDGGYISGNTYGLGKGGNITIKANNIEVINGLLQVLTAYGSGDGGSLEINTEQLRLNEGAQISSLTFTDGKAGNITIKATKLIELIGQNELQASGLFANAIQGSGDGGNITVNTEKLVIREGAQINASNFQSLNLNTPGSGTPGVISINARQVSLNNGQISSASAADGNAGNITIEQAKTVSLENNSQITATTEGAGNAGSIKINSDLLNINSNSLLEAFTAPTSTGDGGNILLASNNVNLTDGGKIGVNSEGAGVGGNIEVIAEEITQNNNGFISAETASTDGGNINLTVAKNILLNRNSETSTTAGTAASFGDGGNITTESEFLILSDNSSLTANAFLGNGGNINLTATRIFVSPSSKITATSQFGIDGIVETNTPDNDPAQGLIELADNSIDATKLIDQDVCKKGINSSYYIIGKGGKPNDPTVDALEVDTVDIDWVKPVSSSENNANNALKLPNLTPITHKKIIPARGWIFNEKGEVVLIGYDPTQTGPLRQQPRINCD